MYGNVLERYCPTPPQTHPNPMRDVAHPQRSIICMPTCQWTYHSVASHIYANVLERSWPTSPHPSGEILAPRVYIYIIFFLRFIFYQITFYHIISYYIVSYFIIFYSIILYHWFNDWHDPFINLQSLWLPQRITLASEKSLTQNQTQATPPGVPAVKFWWCYMEVSWNGGTSKSSILIGFSIINHPAIGVPSFEENPIYESRHI